MHLPMSDDLGAKGSDFFSMLSELLCSNGGIIRVLEGGTYTQEDVIAVISYAATSTANSVEASVSELKRKMPNAATPSADTVFNYIYENEIEEIPSFFRKVNSEILALTGIPDEPVDVAVDFHDIESETTRAWLYPLSNSMRNILKIFYILVVH